MTGAQNDILMIELGLPYTGTTTHVYGKGVNIYRQAPTPSLSGT